MKKILLLTILFASIAIVGCKKKDTPAVTTESNTNDIYVAGLSTNKKEEITVATFWHNGVEQVLSTKESGAFSVFVARDTVYVAGFIYDASGPHAFVTLWKNGIPQFLSTSTYSGGSAISVFVSNTGNVYVAGNVGKENEDKFVPALWKNGILQILSDGTTDARASSVYVSGSDVFVSGYIKNGSDRSSNSVATLWKNGVPQSLSDGTTNADATSVYVSGEDVYVSGYINDVANNSVPILWKNGNKQTLVIPDKYEYDNYDFLKLFISNNIVYTVGGSMLWTNNVPSIVAGNCAAAVSIYVFNKDVYVAGAAYNGIPTIWKNGIYQILNTTPGGCAYDIFVK